MKKLWPRLLFSFLCLVVMLGQAGKFWNIPLVSLLDNYFYDVRVRIFMPNTVDDRIVIVDIDEKSLSEIGHWPWRRNTVADLVRQLTDDYQVAVVGFDVVFAEPDDTSSLAIFEEVGRKRFRNDVDYQKLLQELRGRLDYDAIFADALRGRPVVLGYYFSNRSDVFKSGVLPSPVFPPDAFAAAPEQFVSWSGFGANLPILQAAATSGGHFNPLVDFDGSTRRVPLLVEYEGAYYEALALAMLRAAIGTNTLEAGSPETDAPIEWIDLVTPQGALRIPVDGDVSALVPYRGHERSFPYVSAADVLKGRVSAESLRGRIVIVGTTAPGLNDLRLTPVGKTYPGVEIHANLIAGMLDGDIKYKPHFIVAADMLGVLLAGLILTLALPRLSPVRGSLLSITLLALGLGINLVLWDAYDTILPFASFAITILLIYGFNAAWGFFYESRSKRQFANLFGQYVPPELVDEMAIDPQKYSMNGRNAELTVLFSDVRSFTTISEGLEPRELTDLMNAYLGAMTRVIRRNRGTLDKYIGDAIMAFWGAPVDDAEHARNAVLSALDMQRELRTLNGDFLKRGWPELQIGVGINTGIMTVGDMGSKLRKAYTVMGDAVNLGARLEGITKEYGVGILVGESTREQCPDILFREVDRVRVKGKEKPVAIFEPLGIERELPQEIRRETEVWSIALNFYRQQQWEFAENALRELVSIDSTARLYTLYLERVAQLRTNPPPASSWDGVTTFKTK